MFRAFGTILIIWYLSSLFVSTFSAADKAFTATFEALESAVGASEKVFNE